MTNQLAKRQRFEVTAREKREICVYKIANPKASLDAICQHFEKEFGHKIGRSTVGDIVRAREKWLNIPEESSSLSRTRHAKHEKLEEGLDLWIHDMNSRNMAISDMMLIEKAKDIGAKLNVTNFGYSRGWLARFKSRHSIVRSPFKGVALSENRTTEVNGSEISKSVSADYADEDIFHIDETNLLFKLGPTYTIASDKKCSKDRITVALCTNATGTMKMKPFVIGKTRRPRSFGMDFNPELYVRYRFNAKAWMTSELFVEWLISFDRQMKAKHKHVLLLCDNATRHNTKIKLSNVKLHYLSPNTTCSMQPMVTSIIHAFKAYYRQFLVKHFIYCTESDMSQSLNLRQAIRLVKDAWNAVNASTIINCFRHMDCINQNGNDNKEEIDTPLAELRAILKKVPDSADIMTAEDYVNIDKQKITGDKLTDDDIIKLVDGQNESSDDDEDDEPMCLAPTSHEAREHLEALLYYYENNGEADESNTISSLIASFKNSKGSQTIIEDE